MKSSPGVPPVSEREEAAMRDYLRELFKWAERHVAEHYRPRRPSGE